MTDTAAMSHASTSACCESTSVQPLALSRDDEEKLATLAKALGHPMRVRILRLLAESNSCVTGDLVSQLPIAQSTVSEHLRILREAGLVQGEIEGPRTSYCLSQDGVARLKAIVAAL